MKIGNRIQTYSYQPWCLTKAVRMYVDGSLKHDLGDRLYYRIPRLSIYSFVY